jgi:hypothetical protein
MALSEELFQEILDDEVLVDRDKLIAGAKYGVPDSMRAKVWMYLLNICAWSQAFEGKRTENRVRYYKGLRPTTFPNIKNAVNTVVHERSLTEPNLSASVSNILCNYFSCDPNIHFTPGVVHLAIPLYMAARGDEVTEIGRASCRERV